MEDIATARTRLPSRCCCDLGDEVDLADRGLAVDLQRVVDRGHLVRVELDVDDRADDANDCVRRS